MTSSVRSILEAMQAEVLLEGSSLLTRIDAFPHTLVAAHDGSRATTFDEYYESLSREVEDIPRLKLLAAVPNEQGDRYITELINNLDELQDRMQTTTRKLVNFQARLSDAESDIAMLSAEFEGWYILAANEYLTGSGTKLPASNLKAIAKSEFSRLMANTNNGITSLNEAVKILLIQVKMKQKMAQDKFDLGKQQANASWANNLPTFGQDPRRPGLLIEDQEVEEEDVSDDFIPPYVSKVSVPGVTTKNTEPPVFDDTEEEVEAFKTPQEDTAPVRPSLQDLPPAQSEIGELKLLNDSYAEDTDDAEKPNPIMKFGDPQPVRIISAEEALEIMNSGEADAVIPFDTLKPATEPVAAVTPVDELDDLDLEPVKTEKTVEVEDAPIPVPAKKRVPMKFEYSDED